MATAIDDSGGGGRRGNGIYYSKSPNRTRIRQISKNSNGEDKTGSAISSIYANKTLNDSMSRTIVEIPVWLHRDKPPKWISGINRNTTCRDILLSLVKASNPSTNDALASQPLLYTKADVYIGKLVLVEEWRGVVKPLR